MRTSRRPQVLTATLACAAVLLTGCGNGDDGGTDPAAPEPAPTGTSGPPSATGPSPAAIPVIAANTVLRPSFNTPYGPRTDGVAFVAEWDDGRLLLLTAHHLFRMPAAELPTRVPNVEVASVTTPGVTLTTGPPVLIPGARPYFAGNTGNDVAAFRVDTANGIGVQALADVAPNPGAQVFLLAKLPGSAALVHPAVVTVTTGSRLVYRFTEPGLQMRGSDGAPVVDASGAVVGIHLTGAPGGGSVLGTANPITAIRPMVAAAIAAAG